MKVKERYEKVKRMVDNDLDSFEIAKVLKVSNVTIYNILKSFKDEKYLKLLRINGRKKQALANFKNGQAALYEKLRKEVRNNKIKCEKCDSDRNVEIHHKERIHYDKEWNGWKADNWKHNKENIIFLCNSCHQKLHWKEDSRISKLKHGLGGRFIKNESM